MSGGRTTPYRWFEWLAFAAVASLGVLPGSLAASAVGDGAAETLAESAAQPMAELADLELRYDQEDGPDSGHIRVTLTPELRPLTLLEARSAAQQAFLKALDEPGLGEPIRRVRVVVRLMPATHPVPDGAEKVILYLHKGGREWAVQSAD